jgi:tyrosine-protein phosphatase YwqE
MNESVSVTIVKIEGNTLKAMAEELKKPSIEQKIAGELFSLREKNEILEKQLEMVKQDRSLLKTAVEAGISTIIATAYEAVDAKGRKRLDKYRTDIGNILKTSDLVGMLIGEE